MPNVCDDGRVRGAFILPVPGGGDARFWPYAGGGSRATLTRAINIIQSRIYRTSSSCNTYFSHLPGSLRFDDIWTDPDFWLYWDPRGNPGFYGATSGKNTTVSQFALAKGTWVTVATIVHEMAHIGGAPGAPSMAAENALPKCGLAGLVDPGRRHG